MWKQSGVGTDKTRRRAREGVEQSLNDLEEAVRQKNERNKGTCVMQRHSGTRKPSSGSNCARKVNSKEIKSA